MEMLNHLVSLQNVYDQVEKTCSTSETESVLQKVSIKDVVSALFISTIL